MTTSARRRWAGAQVRMLLIVADPAAVCARAVKAGARQMAGVELREPWPRITVVK